MTTTLDIPQGWQKIRLKRIANLNPSKGTAAVTGKLAINEVEADV